MPIADDAARALRARHSKSAASRCGLSWQSRLEVDRMKSTPHAPVILGVNRTQDASVCLVHGSRIV